jgi:hypothetical protein
MRSLVRHIADGCLSAVNHLMAAAFDFALVSVFRSHFRQALALERYRPVYSPSGRRNRVRW